MNEGHRHIAKAGEWAVSKITKNLGPTHENFSTRWGIGEEVVVPVSTNENTIEHAVELYPGMETILFRSPGAELTLFDTIPVSSEDGIELSSVDGTVSGFFHTDGHFMVEVDPNKNK